MHEEPANVNGLVFDTLPECIGDSETRVGKVLFGLGTVDLLVFFKPNFI